MTCVLPIGLNNYLGTEKSVLPEGIKSEFYLSWEDGLWDILHSFQIKKNALILVPTFFCIDVVKNMKQHGLRVEYYQIDKNLQPRKETLLRDIRQKNPKIIVLFHPVGITNTCLSRKVIEQIPQETIIIEDAVHRIIIPADIEIHRDNYFCMTSLRKVVPLQGSFMYGKSSTIRKLHGANKNTYIYSYSILLLWYLMQSAALLQNFFQSILFLSNLFGNCAEWCMKIGYEIIGDNKTPGFSLNYFKEKYSFIDHEKIRIIKISQEIIYRKNIAPILPPHMYIPHYSDEVSGELRGFPIVITGNRRKEIITKIRKKGIFIRSELEGCPWTDDRSIIYLPIGVHLSTNDILHIVDIVKKALN